MAKRLWLGVLLALLGCDGIQSGLEPAGREAQQLAVLFWWMTAGAVVIWLAVMGLGIYAVRARPETQTDRRAQMLIIGGGAVVPTLLLGVLLVYGLAMLPGLVAPAPPGSLKIDVAGELWWWRIRYSAPDGTPVELANEIRLPVGEPVEFQLQSPNVIHALWIPSLGGKKDMVPGRVTRMMLNPIRTGVFRGTCAEYCGASHALMSFYAVVTSKDEFNSWLADQAKPALEPVTPLARRGAEQFLLHGCAACHSIRGTTAAGVIGPDLTHVGSRLSLAAGTLTNQPQSLARWIAQTHVVKPAVQMPSFGMLSREELEALSAYLEGLK